MKKYFNRLDKDMQAEVVECVVVNTFGLQDAADMISHELFNCGIWRLEDEAKIFICNKLASWINGQYRCNLHLKQMD